MRLINVHTRELEEHFGDALTLPKYPILSHTWLKAKEEDSFQDYQRQAYNSMKGYIKIQYTCAQAVRDGLNYIWVDTCCTIQTHHQRQFPTKRVAYAAENGGRCRSKLKCFSGLTFPKCCFDSATESSIC
jgi:hypothetical protein